MLSLCISLCRATTVLAMDEEFSKYVFISEIAAALSSSTGPTWVAEMVSTMSVIQACEIYDVQ